MYGVKWRHNNLQNIYATVLNSSSDQWAPKEEVGSVKLKNDLWEMFGTRNLEQ